VRVRETTDMDRPQGLNASFLRYFQEVVSPKFGVDLAAATTKDVCNQVILPLTKKKQCPLIDLLPMLRAEAEADGYTTSSEPSWQGNATAFVSHAWKYPVTAPAGVMLEYAKTEDPEAYFWFDLFINNQNGFEITHSFEWLCGRFKDSIRAIGKVILVLSPWNDPIPLTRSWCLWELVSTAELAGQVEFVVRLPAGEHDHFTTAIRENAGVVYQSLLDVDARRAEASVDSDRIMIAEAIEKTVGYAAVNAMVKDQMTNWIISTVRGLLRAMEAAGQQDEFEYGAFAFQANQILSAVSSDAEERLGLMQSALRVLSKEFEASHPYIVSCHQSLGVIYTDLDRLQEAEVSLQTALKLSQASTECAALTESHIMVRTGGSLQGGHGTFFRFAELALSRGVCTDVTSWSADIRPLYIDRHVPSLPPLGQL
jgi:tetratricopeptide (TPR) repeat protein